MSQTENPEIFPARVLALLCGANPPTAEQEEVITAPPGQLLVVAGAGSGKTETISNRLVYWVVNSGLAPEAVLGLTFTRKAAGEMAARFTKRLDAFAEVMESALGGAQPPLDYEALEITPTELQHSFTALKARNVTPEVLRRPVSVSTYDSYASSLLREFGSLIGREAGFTSITDASRYQIMTDLVQSWGGDLGTDKNGENTEKIVKDLLSLANDTNSHLVKLEAMKATYHSYFVQAQHLWNDTGIAFNSDALRDLKRVLQAMEFGENAVEVIRAFNNRKRELLMADFSDQTREAVGLVDHLPEVGESQKDRFQMVFLDEFQDTSMAQMRFLAGIFKDSPVTAVGDPNQAIYGWRGASAASMEDFGAFFCSNPEHLMTRTLRTSWRNDRVILEAANRISFELAHAPSAADSEGSAWQEESPQAMPPLQAREKAEPGRVYGVQTLTDEQQNQAIVNFLRLWQAQRKKLQGTVAPEKLPTAAVLCRKKVNIAPIVTALQQAGIPYQTRGMQGVLDDPGVKLVRAALEVTADSGKSGSLLVLLDHFRLGFSDLHSLSTCKCHETLYHHIMSYEPGVSDEAKNRLAQLREVLAQLHSNAPFSTPSGLARIAQRLLGLDIEQQLPNSPCNGAAFAEFLNLIRGFETTPGATLSGFLSWLSVGESEEASFAELEFEVDNAAVQILTMHAAKGLEWDWVAVPNLNKDTFPSRSGKIWLKERQVLPYPLRSDSQHLPDFYLKPQVMYTKTNNVSKKKGLLEVFKAPAALQTLTEESRLAYVAFTRAKSRLLLALSWFERQTKMKRGASAFYQVQENPHHHIFTDTCPWCPSDPGDFPTVQNPDTDNATGSSRNISEGIFANGENLLTPFNADTFAEEAQRLGITPPQVSWPDTEVRTLPEGASNPAVDAFEGGVWPAPAWTDFREDLRASVELTENIAKHGNPDEGIRQDSPEELETRLYKLLHFSEKRLNTGDLLGRISATGMANLSQDSEGFLLQKLRPLPQEPSMAARLGTYMHAWIASQLEHEDTLDFDAGMEQGFTPEQRDKLHQWQEHYRELDFLGRMQRPEVEFGGELYLDGETATVIPLRIDAKFEEKDTGKIWIIDWKTGSRPTPKQYARWLHQLGIYRLYWKQEHPEIPVDDIECAYVFLNEAKPERRLLSLADIQEHLGLEAYTAEVLIQDLSDKRGAVDTILDEYGY